MDTSKLTKSQLETMLQELLAQQSNGTGLIVKFNQSKGVYIRSDKFQAWSERKQKSYTYGLNIPFEVAKVLFNDTVLLKEIKEKINNLK